MCRLLISLASLLHIDSWAQRLSALISHGSLECFCDRMILFQYLTYLSYYRTPQGLSVALSLLLHIVYVIPKEILQ